MWNISNNQVKSTYFDVEMLFDVKYLWRAGDKGIVLLIETKSSKSLILSINDTSYSETDLYDILGDKRIDEILKIIGKIKDII